MRIRDEPLTYSDVTARALTVETKRDWRLLFWQRAQFVPFWDVGGVWVTSEWLETTGDASGENNFEVIHDKACRHSGVEPLLCNDAVARVHWRYALTSTRGEVFHGDGGADEFLTVFPAGYCARQLVGNPGAASDAGGNPRFWEVAEIILINPKGTLPTDYLPEHVATFSNLRGDTYERHWCKEDFLAQGQPNVPPSFLCREHPSSADWTEFIIRVHFDGNRPDPFLVIPNRQDLFPHSACTTCGGDHPSFLLWPSYPIWSHWPAYTGTDYAVLLPGTREAALERATHSSVVSVGAWYGQQTKDSWTFPKGAAWHFLFGVTDESDESLRALASSWLHPSAVADVDGAEFVKYDLAQMAYCFRAHSASVRFRLKPEDCCKNPFFLIANWQGAERPDVRLNGSPVHSVRCGVKDDTLHLWVEGVFRTEIEVCIG
jgi:hypothetical protein